MAQMARGTNAARHLGLNSIRLQPPKPPHASRPPLIGPRIASLHRRNTQEDANATMPEDWMPHAVRNKAEAELRGPHGVLRPSGFVLLYCAGEHDERNQFGHETSGDHSPRYGGASGHRTLVTRRGG